MLLLIKTKLFFLSFRGLLLRDYPADSTAPIIPHNHLSIANKPVHCLQYSGETVFFTNIRKVSQK